MTQVEVAERHRVVRTSARALTGPVRWCSAVLAWAVVLACLGALAVAVALPRIVGGTPFTILTSSMEPHLPPGTLVVDRPVRPEEIGVGDVVTYQLVSGEPDVVTHRVVEVSQSLVGDLTFRTQGDANDATDPSPVLPEQVRGRLWYSVPELGRVNLLLTGAQRQDLVDVAAAGLGLYALVMFGVAVRRRTGDS